MLLLRRSSLHFVFVPFDACGHLSVHYFLLSFRLGLNYPIKEHLAITVFFADPWVLHFGVRVDYVGEHLGNAARGAILSVTVLGMVQFGSYAPSSRISRLLT